MSNQPLNPFASPTSISGSGSNVPVLSVIVLAVCVVLSAGMLVTQQVSIGMFEDQGIQLPKLTRWLTSPVAALLPLVFLPSLWKTVRWESKWRRRTVNVVALSFFLLWGALFCFSLYLPMAAIRSGLGG